MLGKDLKALVATIPDDAQVRVMGDDGGGGASFLSVEGAMITMSEEEDASLQHLPADHYLRLPANLYLLRGITQK